MRPLRTLFSPAVLASSLTVLSFTARAFGGALSFNTVLNDEDFIGGSITFHDADQVVAGNGGVVATVFGGSGDSGITFNATNGNANTLIVAADSSLGSGPKLHSYDNSTSDSFDIFSELSLSRDGQTRLHFLAQDSAGAFGLYRADVTGTVAPSTIQRDGTFTLVTDTTPGTLLSDLHQQSNAAGQVVYGRKQLSDDQQSFLRTGLTEFDSPYILTQGDLKEFNFISASSPIYKRLAVTANGSVVFRATTDPGGAIGIYRSTDLVNPIASVGQRAIVLGADDTHVLYSDRPDAATTALYLIGDPLINAPLVTYKTANNQPHNAVMTQGTRIAFFTPDNPLNHDDVTAYVGYYRPGFTAAQFIAKEGDSVSDNGDTFTIQNISSTGTRNSVPMVNDRGTVVFDATLLTTDDTTVTALLFWEEATGQLQVAVKTADEIGNFGDTYNGHMITGLVVDATTDQAGDVLKDGLSDDNWLAFAIQYDIGGNDHQAVVSVLVPEPSAIGLVIGMTGIGALRRRTRKANRR